MRRQKQNRSVVPAKAGTHAKPMQDLCFLPPWIPAFERVKKSANRLKSGPQRRPREGGDPSKSLFQLDKWIPAFAGMTLRSLPEARNFDFFTRSCAGMTPCIGNVRRILARTFAPVTS